KGDFFKDRVNSIKELVSNRHIYNRREKEKAKLLAEKTSKPFALGYGSDWGSIYSGLGLMGTLFSIAAICMGVDFSSKDRLISMDKCELFKKVTLNALRASKRLLPHRSSCRCSGRLP
ncbi:MAG: hypothetical protein PUF78_02865, partial [Lachnospiraceae bacterium]|nr:hypothetical protein [Lachnospiraceae bacterium]